MLHHHRLLPMIEEILEKELRLFVGEVTRSGSSRFWGSWATLAAEAFARAPEAAAWRSASCGLKRGAHSLESLVEYISKASSSSCQPGPSAALMYVVERLRSGIAKASSSSCQPGLAAALMYDLAPLRTGIFTPLKLLAR